MTNDKRILAVVVTYHPDLTLLQANISAFADRVGEVYVWDNTPAPENAKIEEFLRQHFDNVVIEGWGENKGISYALNHGWKYAQKQGCDVVLTMDQDSRFEDFNTYLTRVQNKWVNDGLCICGPTPNRPQDQKHEKKGFIPSIAIITSGMLIPIELLIETGGYCEDFFVDAIDFDFCYRIREKGYEAYMDQESNLIQVFGEPRYKKILGMKIHGYGYSPKRVHGIFRNHIITWRRHHHPGKLLRHIIKQYCFNYILKGVLLVEDKKWAKLKAAFKGTVDGFKFKINDKSK